MARFSTLTLCSLALTWFISCDNTSFISSTGAKDEGTPTPNNNESPGDALKTPLDLDSTKAIVDEAGQIIACPRKPQKVLILDFKSGWWAGDGGAFFTKVLSGLTAACVGSVSLEYHHILRKGSPSENGIKNEMILIPGQSSLVEVGSNFNGGAFTETNWNAYQQIWLLSGSHADLDDVRITDPFFSSILQQITASNANLFIAGGYGSITHANALSQHLQSGDVFATSQTEGRILNPMRGVEILSRLSVVGPKSDHILFGRGASTFADRVKIHRSEAGGDAIVNQSFEVIAHDNDGQASIAVGRMGSRHVVLDSGLQRYYAIWQSLDQGTLALLRNILSYLSQPS